MKKVLYGLFAGLFLALCLTLSVGMLLTPAADAAANEQLAQMPQIQNADGINTEYLADLKKWVNDRFFLRTELISADRWLSGKLLATSGEPDVVLGKDGWLFFQPTVKDYTGTEPMSDRDLRYAAHNLSIMARYCRENGKDFLFVIAPNKNSLYGQYMPDLGVTATVRDAQRLHALLDDLDVPYTDLFSVFAQQEQPLYFAHDSHWNSQGAALGADTINQAFGLQSQYYASDFSQGQTHTGDLYAMLYPGLVDPEQNPVCGTPLQYTFTGRATQPDAITLETEGQGSGRLLVYRDSFGNLLYPYLADSSASARFSRSTLYDLTLEADRVLVELVERNLTYLITYGAILPAPEAEITLPEKTAGSLTVTTGKRAGLVQVQGKLPQEADAAWLVTDGTARETFLLAGGAFLASVPEEANYTHVVYTVGEEMLMYEITLEEN